MSIGAILVVILVLALIGAFPTGGYGYGNYAGGGLGLVLLVLIFLLVLGKI